MAKFRTNHQRGSKGSTGTVVRVGLFSALIGGLFFIAQLFLGGQLGNELAVEPYYYLPIGGTGTLVQRAAFALSYNEAHEQAEWVAYRLSATHLEPPLVPAAGIYREDPQVPTGSARPEDYSNAAFTRGQLVPAADRAYRKAAVEATFLMSNISPQARLFNLGIWRELEELARGWAKDAGELYIITGPLLQMAPLGAIGENEITVPGGYFKVLLDIEPPELRAIGFALPNTVSMEPLPKFAVAVDEIEAQTGLDFFQGFLPADVEAALEAEADTSLWAFSRDKYQERVENWNNQ